MCKAGAGRENTPGACDTPGFPLCNEPSIHLDCRNSLKLHMPRNNTRVNQTSMDALQSWRGNCDVQILMCDCDLKHPRFEELARVTDYVVAYACKGNVTLKQEREINRDIVMQ